MPPYEEDDSRLDSSLTTSGFFFACFIFFASLVGTISSSSLTSPSLSWLSEE